MTDLDELVADLHAHLEATAQLPVDRAANRWLGEATAVVADIDGADVSKQVVARRVGRVEELLEHVEDTGHPEANEHVEDAKAIAKEIRRRA